MINHLCGRLSKCQNSVVVERHDTGVGDLLREEIFQPERLGLAVSPGLDGVTVEAMHGDDTGGRERSANG